MNFSGGGMPADGWQKNRRCDQSSGGSGWTVLHIAGLAPAIVMQLHFKNCFVAGVQNLSDQDDLVGIQMALPYLNFGYSASGDIAAGKLELCGKHILGHMLRLPESAYIISDFLFDIFVHGNHLVHRYQNNSVDFIVQE